MKKYLIALLLLSSYIGYSQTVSSLPSNLGSLVLFRDNPVTLKAVFPSGYLSSSTVSSDVYQITGISGTKIASIIPTTSKSGDTIKVSLTTSQVGRLASISGSIGLFIKINTTYVLGSTITVRVGSGNANTTPFTVNLPEIGIVKINLVGDVGSALRYAHLADSLATIAKTASTNAQSNASISIAAKDSARIYALSTANKKVYTSETLTNLRSLAPTDTNLVYILSDKLRYGQFKYDPLDVSSLDNGGTIIVTSGGKRFKRIIQGTELRPEWFGAKVDDEVDDAPAIQAMFNAVSPSGAILLFSSGIYYVGSELTFKSQTTAPAYNYKISLRGAGVGRTQIFGKVGFTGNMFELNTGTDSGTSKDLYITIQDIEFRANTASKIINATEITSVKIYNSMFFGGQDVGIQVGNPGGIGGYSVYMYNNYHNGQRYGNGQNNGLMRFNNMRFAVIDGMESDGGKYGVEFLGSSDKNIVINSKIEGTKRAGILFDNTNGSGGGENKIINTMINPYAGTEAQGLFDGQINCIEINSQGGGNIENIITGNTLYAPRLTSLPNVFIVNSESGTFTPGAGVEVLGLTSGAQGHMEGFNTSAHRMLVTTYSGTFTVGETIRQVSNSVTAVIASETPRISSGIKLSGGGGTNIINGNNISGLPVYGIYNEQNDNVISNNTILANTGLYASHTGRIQVTNNFFYSASGTGINRANIGEIINTSNSFVDATNINTSDYYLKSTGGTVTGATVLSGTTNTITGLRTTGDFLPTTDQNTNAGSDAARYLSMYGIYFNGDAFIARTTSGMSVQTSDLNTRAQFANDGSLIIQPGSGSFSSIASAALQVNSTSKGALLPRMTTTQRDAISSPAEGIEIYNITVHNKQFYNGTVWKTVVTD